MNLVFLNMLAATSIRRTSPVSMLKRDYSLSNYLIVFDINETLLMKIDRNDKESFEKVTSVQKKCVSPFYWQYLIIRQNSDVLQDFLHSHNINYIFWSSATRKITGQKVEILEKMGFTRHQGYFGREDCEIEVDKYNNQIEKKNLMVASKKYNKQLENCLLIDNKLKNQVGSQNMYLIPNISFGSEDNELLVLVRFLDKFVKCKRECFFKLLDMVSNINHSRISDTTLKSN